ncbi:MAG: N-acetyltransferase family protein [Planctomycetota bacterium]
MSAMPDAFANLTLRDATHDDLPAIVKIHNESIPGRQASAYLNPVTVENRRKWFDAHSPGHRPLWVVCDEAAGGETIAWGCLSDYSPRPTYDITAEVSLYITPSRQRQGIGPWLVQKLIDHAGNNGVEVIIALVFAHNTPSMQMHLKLGFEQWGYLPRVTNMDGLRRDVVVLGIETVATSEESTRN